MYFFFIIIIVKSTCKLVCMDYMQEMHRLNVQKCLDISIFTASRRQFSKKSQNFNWDDLEAMLKMLKETFRRYDFVTWSQRLYFVVSTFLQCDFITMSQHCKVTSVKLLFPTNWRLWYNKSPYAMKTWQRLCVCWAVLNKWVFSLLKKFIRCAMSNSII